MGAGIWLGAVLHRLRHAAGDRAPGLSGTAAMTDIVARLRNLGWETCHEAADEITRLREHVAALQLVATAHEPEVERLRAEIEWLREVVAAAAPKP